MLHCYKPTKSGVHRLTIILSMKESEKRLESNLKKGIEKLGGKCLKFHSQYDTSWPDRVIIAPKGLCYWVEMKSTGDKPSKLQEVNLRKLRQLGHKAFVIDNSTDLNKFLELVKDEVHSA